MPERTQGSRSTLPSCSTSDTRDMEHHVAAADIPVPAPPCEQFYASATQPEVHPNGQRKAQSQTDAQDATPNGTSMPVNNDPPAITPKNDGKPFVKARKTTEIPKSQTIRVKAQRSRPRLLTLITCVSYLLFHIMGVDIGLRAIRGYTDPRLLSAEAQLSDTTKTLATDYFLNIQLHNLLDIDLDRRYTETIYEECLARGLHKANHVFHGLDFTINPYIRNQTADWVTHNCRRLLYTPQMHRQRESILQAKAEDIRKTLGLFLRTAKYRLALLQYRLRGGDLRLATEREIVSSAIKSNKPLRVLPDMPYGFGLECKEQSRCRLIYTGSATSIASGKSLQSAVADAREQVHKWSWKFEKVYGVINCCYGLSAILGPLLIMAYLFASMVASRRPQSSKHKLSFAAKEARIWKRICESFAHLQPGEVHAIGLIINSALHALLGFQLKYLISEFDRLWLPVGLGYSVFHLAHILAFTFAGSFDESLHIVFKAVEELYLIVQGVEIIPEATKRSIAKPSAHSVVTKPASNIARYFVSPLTPISEDLQQERKAMHIMQGKVSRDYMEPTFRHATETDSEYDSDVQHSSYVDLTGGITLTDYAEEDDLVIVEG